MNSIFITVVIFSIHISFCVGVGVKNKFYEVERTVSANPLEIQIFTLEKEIDQILTLAKRNALEGSNLNLTAVDIIRKLIDTNVTDTLQSYPESCPPSANAHGIYTVKLPNGEPTKVFCDSRTAGPGWTVIQRRVDGSVNFFRNWTQYRNGFGNISHEFFIGLENLHAITSQRPHELYIQLEDWTGEKRFARYDQFQISSEADQYRLEILGTYSGTAGDSLDYNRNMKFTTFDADHDSDGTNCAEYHMGPWWHKGCTYSSLNGLYLNDGKLSKVMSEKGLYWYKWKGSDYSYKTVQMMIRPRCPCVH